MLQLPQPDFLLLLLHVASAGGWLFLWCSYTVHYVVAVVAVVAIAGVMSGLTLGLLSMDRLDLELMLRTGSKQQERLARR
jgi:hypothetical protein